jgi:hypothetical protein
MIVMAFFYPLCSGEYTTTPSHTTLFCMCDVQSFICPIQIDPATADEQSFWSASTTLALLTFTNQKNGVWGKVIGLSHHSGNPQFFPILTIVCQILHLRHCNVPPDTPLATYFFNQK